MLEAEMPVLLVGALAIASLSWWRPMVGASFIITGAIPFYAALSGLGISTSPVLVAVVYLGAAIGAMSRLLTQRKTRADLNGRAVLLFAAFFLIWQVRWLLAPPDARLDAQTIAFAERSRIFMVVFAALPFLLGVTVGAAREHRRLLAGAATWGGLGVLIVISLWISGQGTQGLGYAGRWEPLPALGGITMSIEIGVACLAFLAVTAEWRRKPAIVARGAWIGATLALQIHIAQRGPFLFTVLGIAVYFFASPWGKRLSTISKWIVVSTVATGVSAGLMVSDTGDRALSVSSYTADANEDRIAIIQTAMDAIAERPVLGWGGELVGTPAGNGVWIYSHVFALDPVVETGVAGALPFVALFVLLFAQVRRVWRRWDDASMAASLAVFALVFLEAHVSGHVSTAKHLWLLAGVLVAPMGVARAAVPGSLGAAREAG
jgi:O-antigen ligase